MHAAFQVLLSRLRKDAFLFPGHEYTEMLLQMTCRREQYNEKAREKLLRARQLRAQQKPTIPSTLEEELSYNPYLRASPHELLLLTQCQPCVE
jgi:hydroxyacylglutathione hydrolase